MEVLCRWCMKIDVCDHVDSWMYDEDGAQRVALDVESCPDFQCNPEARPEIICKAILTEDPDEYLSVNVETALDRYVRIAIRIKHNLNPGDLKERMEDLQAELQILNDDVLGMQDAEFMISFGYAHEDNPEVPSGMDENLPPPGKLHPPLPDELTEEMADMWMETNTECTSECPICNTPMKRTCPQCGYEPED